MLVLASASPRRRELLTQAGFSFHIHPADVPELQRPHEDPIAFALRLAREKAEATFAALEAAHDQGKLLVLGADTIVVAPDNSVFGKPADDADAARMLRLLSGATHRVITGVCLRSATRTHSAVELTYVTMQTISEQEIAAYLASGEPSGKAGGYAIQGYAARWIPRVDGCFYNVVGLPIALVSAMLEAEGSSPNARWLSTFL